MNNRQDCLCSHQKSGTDLSLWIRVFICSFVPKDYAIAQLPDVKFEVIVALQTSVTDRIVTASAFCVQPMDVALRSAQETCTLYIDARMSRARARAHTHTHTHTHTHARTHTHAHARTHTHTHAHTRTHTHTPTHPHTHTHTYRGTSQEGHNKYVTCFSQYTTLEN